MNWLRENPFVSGLIFVAVAGCGALGFLISQAASTYSATLESYNQAVANLHKLQNAAPFPNNANLAKATELKDQFAHEFQILQERMRARQVPIDPSITPEQFQDDLRTAFNEITRRANAAKVGLPENFYLGFEAYRDSLPSDKAAPALARQLKLVVKLVGDLIGPNPEKPMVRSIDSFARQPLAIEAAAAATPATPAAGKGAEAFERMPVSVAFTSEQGRFRIALNGLLDFPQFLIIRSLSIENTQIEGPHVAAEAAAAPTTQAILSEIAPPAKGEDLNVLLGRELLKVNLSIEFLDFTAGQAAKEPAKKR